jgi:diguanylate cyclase (GGDEF)-like protein
VTAHHSQNGAERWRDDVPEVRVILVGRTGLDARLRLDPGVELVRVRNRLEAVGELSDAAAGRAPVRSVVIVGNDTAPADHAREGEFTQALRRLDPAVRVLAVGRADAVYDGALPPDAGSDVLRRAVRGLPVEVQAPPVLEAPAQPRPSTTDHWEDDAALARLLLVGDDLTDAAVSIARKRLRRDDAVFLPDAAQGAEVSWRGHRFGTLVCNGADAPALAAAAAWLAAWLALRDQHAQLRQAAFTDPLTGAYNRRYFDHFLGVTLGQAHEQRRPVTILVFDVDDLKTFNDRHGHMAGDMILRETVRLLTSVIRPTDRVCRIGGDEFAVIFHEPQGPRTASSSPPKSVFDIARRFQRQVCAQRFPKLGLEAPGTLTVSGGLATYPWDGRTPEELLAAADTRAMRSKHEGKNAIRYGAGPSDVCSDPRD